MSKAVHAQPRHPAIKVRPNRHAFTLAALLLAMWYAAGAQSHGAVYLLAYGLAALALVSWLHARANLRSLDLRAGSPVRSRSHDCYRVPFTIQPASARPPCGIEISAAGARSPLFVPEVKAGQVFRSELSLPAAAITAQAPVSLVARSLYPLGFFTAETRVTAAPLTRPPPAPSGDLPLPAMVTAAPEKTSAAPLPGLGSSGTGDDFAGTRAWQPGDSPRHIDWKAAARDRPLMTKQWAGDRVSFVPMDWNAISLPDEQKPAQIAQWIRQCEAACIPFGLKLPGVEIGPGIGPRHSAKCLDELAAVQPPVLANAGGKSPRWKRLPFAHETAPSLTGRPVLVICLALLLALPPLLGDVSLIGMACLLLAAGLRLSGLSGKLPPYGNLFLILIGAHLVAFTAADLRGIETATAMLLVFLGGKVLESRSPRDFQVLAILAIFLCMCGLSFEPSLGWSLWAFGVFFFVIVALVRFRRGASGLLGPAKTAVSMAAQAAPILAALFLLFPRCPEGLVGQLVRRNQAQSGLSASLQPGGITAVALSSRVAFRARFTGGESPDSDERYWRCIVLWECDGLSWSKGGFNPARLGPPADDRNVVEQEITIEPSGLHWLPALDRPVSIAGTHAESFITTEHAAFTREPADNPQKYFAASLVDPPIEPINRLIKQNALNPPKQISPRVEGLANQLRDLAEENAEDGSQAAVEGALRFFRENGFRYTVEPGAYTGDALDEFLFERRLGFCEHFAASFATLMRLADVPSRVVLGYLGGEYAERGDYWIVRQSDAHAWAEVWLENKGWARIDPTAALAPGRVTSGLQGALSGDLGFFAAQRNTWWWRAAVEARMMWDMLNYEWLNRVIDADEEAHRMGLRSFGFDGGLLMQLVWLGIALGIAALVIVFWLRRPSRHPDPLVRAWQKFCGLLGRRGVARLPHEGAEAFAARAAAALPRHASGIIAAAAIYNEARYGGKTSRIGELRDAIRKLGRR